MTIAWIPLAVLAIALAWPVPIAFARASWPARAPGTALLLWQAIALSGGLSMIGSLLAFGLTPVGGRLVSGAAQLGAHLLTGPLPRDVGVLHIAALTGALTLTAHLCLNLANTSVRAERQRRRHRAFVELLSSPLEGSPGTRMLDHPAPVAYCLPGIRSVTVLTEGLVQALDAAQLRAVLAHERAHLRQYHHLVLLAFTAWNEALPWFPIANRAQKAVAILVEMLADDDARREVDDDSLVTAIAIVGSAHGEAAGESTEARFSQAPDARVDPETLGARITRLVSPVEPLPLSARRLIIVASAALVLVPMVALFMLL